MNEILNILQTMANAAEQANQQVPVNKNNCSFETALKPGNIAIFHQGDEMMCGIIMPNKVMYKISADGKIKGYLGEFTANTPIKIEAIYEPTEQHFALHEYKNMKKVWENKEPVQKVKKSLREIEQALGLEPGSLQID